MAGYKSLLGTACVLRVLYNVNLPQARTGMASLADLGHLALLIIFLNYHVLTEASDPDPVGDYASDAKSFVIRDIFTNGEILHDTGGIRAAVTTDNFPAITAQGITYVRVRVAPCGCTLAHTHPRASEIMTLISGGPLQVGLIDTQGNAHVEILYPGDVTLFPRGLLHFELNVGNEIADYLAALNSQNPGTLTSASALFKIPKRALASSLNLPWNLLISINSTISQSVGPSLQRVSHSGCVPGQDITIDI